MSRDRSMGGAIAGALVITAMAGGAGALLLVAGVDWTGWRPATCMPTHCFCEAVGDGAIRQPANTWSNLAFVFVGGWILAARPKVPPAPFADVFGAVVVFLGVGSFLYHASMSFLGQWVDNLSMYLFPTFVALYNLSRLRAVPGRVFVAAYLGINALLGVLIVVLPEARRFLFGGLLALMLASEVVARRRLDTARDLRWFVAGTALFAVAFGIWNLDISGHWCDPHSLVQGHAAWHTLDAFATGAFFVYYASERPTAAV